MITLLSDLSETGEFFYGENRKYIFWPRKNSGQISSLVAKVTANKQPDEPAAPEKKDEIKTKTGSGKSQQET